MRGVLALAPSFALACREPDPPPDPAVPFLCDRDGDAHASVACETGDDCDDEDAGVHPGATEEPCNGKDDDCDGKQPAEPSWYADADEDGYGDPANTVAGCDPPPGYVTTATDCNDGDPTVSPGDPERCDNALDDDCDGVAMVGEDADGDGFLADTCLGGNDCDDGAPEIHIGAADECGDGIDSDCNGSDWCGYEGDYDLAEATATLRSDFADYDAGRLVEAGDVTGDGNDDIFIATLFGGGGYGGGYIVPGPVLGESTLEDSGVRIESSPTTYGASRSIGLGDANGDGVDDVSFGAPYSHANGQYIVFGPVTADMDLASAADAWLTGRAGTYCAHGSDLGDLDDDGYEDAVIGAYYDSTGGHGSGTLFVEFGPLSGHVDLASDADVEIAGVNAGAFMGRMVHAGEDINGDGLADFATNAAYDSTGGPAAGGVYVVYGPAAIDSLADADGFLVGESPGAYAGTAFTVGDFDGDALADVASFGYNGGGSVAITLGPASGEIDLSTAETIIQAASWDQQLGSGLGSGDMDLDGIDELLIGAPGDSACGSWCGAAFLVFSPPPGTWEITEVARASFRGVQDSDQSGQGVAIGDLDGDGSGDLIIGGPGIGTGGGAHVEASSF